MREELTVEVDILECEHGSKAISINELRVVGSKCCGRWRAVRRWTVPVDSLRRDLDRALAKVTP